MQKLKENLAIVIGLAIPVVMVVVIAGIIYGERMFTSIPAPTTNFVYALGDTVIGTSQYGYAPSVPSNPCATEYYRVASGTIKRYPTDPKDRDQLFCKDAMKDMKEPMFFLHDVATNVSTRLTWDEASKIALDDTPKSKDGYEYTQNIDRGNIGILGLFGGGNYDYTARYLKNGTRYEKMNLQIPTETYYGADVFLGWVTK